MSAGAVSRTLGKCLRETGQALHRFGHQCTDSTLIKETCEWRDASTYLYGVLVRNYFRLSWLDSSVLQQARAPYLSENPREGNELQPPCVRRTFMHEYEYEYESSNKLPVFDL